MFNEQDAFSLLEKQQDCWPEFKERILQLGSIQIKNFHLESTQVLVQINPSRIISSNAKVDEKSIKERKCFLCEKNRPSQQIGIEILPNFTLLVNPFPILKGHFTIPLNTHSNQEIKPYIHQMLEIAKLMPSFHIFYNGPQCGASAPDHMHFQAILKGQLPFLKNFISKKFINITKDATIANITNLGRDCIVIESNNIANAKDAFIQFYDISSKDDKNEPMMNIFAEYDIVRQIYTMYVFRRKAHRPSMYYSKDDFWMISPGAIDMAGVLVLPRIEDFDRINLEVIKDIYNQVSL